MLFLRHRFIIDCLHESLVAQVPHGTFLLDHLKFPRSFTGPDSLLVMGGIDYGSGIWPALPGTACKRARGQ